MMTASRRAGTETHVFSPASTGVCSFMTDLLRDSRDARPGRLPLPSGRLCTIGGSSEDTSSSSSRDTSIRDIISRDTSSRDTSSRDIISRDTMSRDTSSRDTSSRDPEQAIVPNKNLNSEKNSKKSKNGWVKVKRKNRYRGKGKINSKENIFTVLLTNLRGYKSKETSLRKIIGKLKPSLVAMNETLLAGNMKVSIPSYTSWSKNRTEKGGGGIATSVAENYKNYTVGAGQGEGEEEYFITRIDCFSPALNIINCYGAQRREKKEDIERKWKNLRQEMELIRAKNELCCLTGDLNALVGHGKFDKS